MPTLSVGLLLGFSGVVFLSGIEQVGREQLAAHPTNGNNKCLIDFYTFFDDFRAALQDSNWEP